MKRENSENIKPPDSAILHKEVEKRYLAYALSTIVSRALPDVRDGLKPVHRRILYAMYSMRLNDAAKPRKSAAVVGEVIGKYHPHGDQAAYDAMVRMAQDFSLRYPLIEGSGNFGSVDGDSPAAMRYTETRLSPFAGLLLREIEQGTSEFRPTYDGMGDEPLILPAAVPNLLLNGSTGIAVGMSCSFPPHNLREVIAACRASIQKDLTVSELLKFITGPDFPTGGEALGTEAGLHEIYSSGHGAVPVRGTYVVEQMGRGKKNIVITSIPYTVNKSRLVERIAILIREKRLKVAYDVRDESTTDVRVVVELRSGDTNPESVMAFLYRHTDLQINFPFNFIAVTPAGTPDRLGLDKIIRYFLDFRYEKTTLRLQHRLAELTKRIHILEGFELLFIDIDEAIRIIRSARSRDEARNGLKTHFGLDDEQADAILEMRLYRLVGLEIGKLIEELTAKRKEAEAIARDLASPVRLWKLIDRELADISAKFGDDRKTRMISHESAPAMEYDPDEFIENEDTTVIVSAQGWIRRLKSEVEDPSNLKFHPDDGLLAHVRVNTAKTVALFTNLGKVYVIKAADIPAGGGFGEHVGKLLIMADGESLLAVTAPDPADSGAGAGQKTVEDDADSPEQIGLFEAESEDRSGSPNRGVLVTRRGYGFRFDYDTLREPTKRIGKRLVALKRGDDVVAVRPEDRDLVMVAADSGHALAFPVDQTVELSGPGLGVRFMKLAEDAAVVGLELFSATDELVFEIEGGATAVKAGSDIVTANRDGKGRRIFDKIGSLKRRV